MRLGALVCASWIGVVSAQPSAVVPTAATHIEVRDSSVDALPDVRVPVSPDLVLAVVDVAATDVAFKFRFRPGSFEPSAARLSVELDIDQNAASGAMGIEYQVNVFPAGGRGAVVLRPVDTAVAIVGTGPVSFVDDGCDVTIPRRLLGGGGARFDFRVHVYAEAALSTVLDLLPDIGMVRVQ